MEVKNGEHFLKSVMLAEFLGTAGLMLGYNMNGGSAITALTLYTMIMLTARISGGHINPAVTLGVFIEQKEYSKNICTSLLVILAQVLGAVFALPIGYMLRVTVHDPNGGESFEPGVNSFAPPILVATDGKPAYGQVMLAETIGTFFFVLTILIAKKEITENGRDPAIWILAMAIANKVEQDMFADVSGGFVNPALAFA